MDRANYLVGTGEAAVHLGAAFNVTPDVHVADLTFRDLYDAQGGDAASALNHYLHRGRLDAELVRDVISDVQGAPVHDGRLVAPMTILEFGAGFGRVVRHFKNVAPNAKVVALDVEESAMYFNAAHLGLQAVVCDPMPERISPFFEFDVVVALSFLSSQPQSRMSAWLEALARFAKPTGIVLITMPGAGGPHPLLREIERARNLDLVRFRAGKASGNDDLFVMRKAA